jgi:hypothetical protein
VREHLTLVTIGGPDRPVLARWISLPRCGGLEPWTTILEMADGIS